MSTKALIKLAASSLTMSVEIRSRALEALVAVKFLIMYSTKTPWFGDFVGSSVGLLVGDFVGDLVGDSEGEV